MLQVQIKFGDTNSKRLRPSALSKDNPQEYFSNSFDFDTRLQVMKESFGFLAFG